MKAGGTQRRLDGPFTFGARPSCRAFRRCFSSTALRVLDSGTLSPRWSLGSVVNELGRGHFLPARRGEARRRRGGRGCCTEAGRRRSWTAGVLRWARAAQRRRDRSRRPFGRVL